MATDHQNPFQSPTPVDQPNVAVEIPAILSAIGRAAGLGLLGAGALAIPVLITQLITDELSADGLWGLLVFSTALGWTFATSEILRIKQVQGRYETANQIMVSAGMLGAAFISLLWFHDYLLPGMFPTGPPDHSQLGLLIIALVTVAIHITLLLALRLTRLWLDETFPKTARGDSPQEPANGE
jgi:hypothetical protein